MELLKGMSEKLSGVAVENTFRQFMKYFLQVFEYRNMKKDLVCGNTSNY